MVAAGRGAGVVDTGDGEDEDDQDAHGLRSQGLESEMLEVGVITVVAHHWFMSLGNVDPGLVTAAAVALVESCPSGLSHAQVVAAAAAFPAGDHVRRADQASLTVSWGTIPLRRAGRRPARRVSLLRDSQQRAVYQDDEGLARFSIEASTAPQGVAERSRAEAARAWKMLSLNRSHHFRLAFEHLFD